MKKGRKFTVVIISTILSVLLIISGNFCAYVGVDTAWVSTSLPLALSPLTLYLGANAYQKGKQVNKAEPLEQ